ncbi:MAG: S1-like domain-containing RNA-binding protein, partial [Phycisphaerales bacterium]
MATIGRTNLMLAVRETPSGLYLDGGDLGEILLPGRLIPRGVRAGDKVEAFVHHDSEDRLVATTERPRAEVGGFAAMRV